MKASEPPQANTREGVPVRVTLAQVQNQEGGAVVMVDELLILSPPHKLSFSDAGLRIMITPHFSPRTRLSMAGRVLISEVTHTHTHTLEFSTVCLFSFVFSSALTWKSQFVIKALLSLSPPRGRDSSGVPRARGAPLPTA